MRRRNGFRMARSAPTYTRSPPPRRRTVARAQCTSCSVAIAVAPHSTSCKGRNGATEKCNGAPVTEPRHYRIARIELDFALKQERDDECVQGQCLDERERDDHRGEKLTGAVGIAADRFHRGGADASLAERASERRDSDTDVCGQRDETRCTAMPTSRALILRQRQQRRRQDEHRSRAHYR